jgi:hypothetical protein
MVATSALLTIPPELRDMIFDLVIDADGLITIGNKSLVGHNSLLGKSGLLLSFREIHERYAAALYRRLRFPDLELVVRSTNLNVAQAFGFLEPGSAIAVSSKNIGV